MQISKKTKKILLVTGTIIVASSVYSFIGERIIDSDQCAEFVALFFLPFCATGAVIGFLGSGFSLILYAFLPFVILYLLIRLGIDAVKGERMMSPTLVWLLLFLAVGFVIWLVRGTFDYQDEKNGAGVPGLGAEHAYGTTYLYRGESHYTEEDYKNDCESVGGSFGTCISGHCSTDDDGNLLGPCTMDCNVGCTLPN